LRRSDNLLSDSLSRRSRTSRLFDEGDLRYAGARMVSPRIFLAAGLLLLAANPRSFGNGGAWQTGVPVTGNAAATDEKRATNVTIEDGIARFRVA
jgi:hypothetical protein